MASNKRCSLTEALAKDYSYFAGVASDVGRVADAYLARKKAANVMDFDDLLQQWLQLLLDHEETREMYQRRFQFVLVDEYQDTNRLQSDLLDLLAQKHHNIMVVGDDSQSIYAWRGANFLNILEFPKRYPEARIYKIETNYRSTPEILTLANSAIAQNRHQFSKELVSSRKAGPKPILVVCGDAREEAAFVAQRMLQLRDEGVDLNAVAVLYRAHFHALDLQVELTRRNIPFLLTSGIRYFEQAHVKDIGAYLKFIANPTDELAFKRLTRMMPGIGGKAAEKLWSAFRGLGGGETRPPWAAPETEAGLASSAAPAEVASGEAVAVAPLAAALQRCAGVVPKKAQTAWAEFAIVISQLEEPSVRNQPAKMIQLILEAGYDEYLRATYRNYRARLEDVELLGNYAAQTTSLEELLTQLSLLTNVDAEESEPGGTNDTERVRLSTVHQAKGLEFDVVFLIMLCEGLFPSARSLTTPEDEEEERRLFYVAITRARNELYLSHPLMRFSRTGGEPLQQASRFLGEFSRDLVEEWNLKPYMPYA
jgi:DNA helicase-2/ATP-dependent DNA helicase PcrA